MPVFEKYHNAWGASASFYALSKKKERHSINSDTSRK